MEFNNLISHKIAEVAADRAPVREIRPAVQDEPVFPSAWFEVQGNTKPPIHVRSTELDLGKMRQVVVNAIRRNILTVEIIKQYVFLAFRANPSHNVDAWTSFGQTISPADSDCIMSDIFVTLDTTTEFEPVAVPNLSEKDDPWILLFITGLYRYTPVTNQAYKKTIGENIMMHLSQNRCPKDITINAYVNYKSFLLDDEYRKLMAGIDMYLNRFRLHPFSIARYGTVTTRFKDCACLLDMLYLQKITGMNCGAIARWIWHRGLVTEFERIGTAGQEIDQPDSYMPYFMEMGLSTKSPYSTTTNPNIHYWVHTIGCRLGNARSRNARATNPTNPSALMMHAIIYGFAICRIGAAKLYYSETGEPVPELPPDEEEEEEKHPMPVTLYGNEWLGWYVDLNYILPYDILNDIYSVAVNYGTSRKDTMGMSVYELYGTREPKKPDATK